MNPLASYPWQAVLRLPSGTALLFQRQGRSEGGGYDCSSPTLMTSALISFCQCLCVSLHVLAFVSVCLAPCVCRFYVWIESIGRSVWSTEVDPYWDDRGSHNDLAHLYPFAFMVRCYVTMSLFVKFRIIVIFVY